jgi:hypothetical protein
MASHSAKQLQRQRGQSLLEIAIFFPIFLMLISGVVEFGFLLNTYLNLIEGPRHGARFAVAQDPFTGTGFQDNPTFYTNVATEVLRGLRPITLDINQDDIVISVFTVNGTSVARYPSQGQLSGESTLDTSVGEWHMYGRGSGCTVNVDINCHPSRITTADVVNRVSQTGGGLIPPAMGAVVVEVYYSYHQILKLPWLAMVGDPMKVYTFTVMPVINAAPLVTPTP